MKSKNDFINNIKQKISITDVISSYVTLTKKGNNYTGLCPFHNDSSPSLVVNEQKAIFKCFACNVSGNVFSFVSKINHIGYWEAVNELADKYHIDLSQYSFINKEIKHYQEHDILYKINAQANEYFCNFLYNKDNVDALNYLKQRNISQSLIDYFNIGYAPKDKNIIINLLSNKDNMLMSENLGYKLKDINDAGICSLSESGEYLCLFNNRIVIPIYNVNQKIVGFGGRTIGNDENKYINTPTTKIFNKSEILFNLNNIVNNQIDIQEIYLVEGYMDVIALHRIGITNVVATMGVALNEKHLNTLDILSNLKIINICYDNDEAGKKASLVAGELIAKKYMVSLIDYQTNLKDIDEIVNSDIELAKKQMQNLVDFTTFRINLLLSQYDLNNANNRRIVLNEALKILKHEKDSISINDNVKKLCELLSIDKDIILSKINFSTNKKTTKNFDSNVNIEFETKLNTKPRVNFSTDPTELEILVCCFANSECVGIFENKSNVMFNPINYEIFMVIQQYYFEHPEVNSIDSEKVKEIFKDHEQLIPKAMEIAIKRESNSLKNIQERLSKTIEEHIKRTKKLSYMNILKQMEAMDCNDQKLALLKKIIKK